MKSLFDYLNNILLLESATKYDQVTDSYEELLEKCPGLAKKVGETGNKKLLGSYLKQVVSQTDYSGDKIFIYSADGDRFKIPYAFQPALLSVASDPKYADAISAEIKSDGKVHIAVSNGRKMIGVGQTGSGSVGRVSTTNQEKATCVVWNAYVKNLRENDNFDVNNPIMIKGLVGDISADFDKKWIESFQKQIFSITRYMESVNMDPKNYNMTRYDDGPVGKAYAKFIQNYTKTIGGQKDNFDPADVIIYDVNNENSIISSLNSFAASVKENPEGTKTEFTKILFNTQLLQGISLKKIEKGTGTYDKFNIDGAGNRVEKITNFTEIASRNDEVNNGQVKVLCSGSFNLDNLTDGEGEELGSEKRVVICMRSFGAQHGIDVQLKSIKSGTSPSLGKCPVRVWKEIIGSNESNDLKADVKLFRKMISGKQRASIIRNLEDIVKAAVKEGPACFPFILIH